MAAIGGVVLATVGGIDNEAWSAEDADAEVRAEGATDPSSSGAGTNVDDFDQRVVVRGGCMRWPSWGPPAPPMKTLASEVAS